MINNTTYLINCLLTCVNVNTVFENNKMSSKRFQNFQNLIYISEWTITLYNCVVCFVYMFQSKLGAKKKFIGKYVSR